LRNDLTSRVMQQAPQLKMRMNAHTSTGEVIPREKRMSTSREVTQTPVAKSDWKGDSQKHEKEIRVGQEEKT